MTTDTEFETIFEEALTVIPSEAYDRSQFVPSVGPLDASLILVGEAPGEQEVKHGEPFVGPAGTRLNAVLESIGIERQDLYITNLVKVRPPNNRDPHKQEIETWRPLLDTEITRVDPVGIVPLGNVATRAFLDTQTSMSDIHGCIIERDDCIVVPTYHPAATFYNDQLSQRIEDDIRTAAKKADLLTE